MRINVKHQLDVVGGRERPYPGDGDLRSLLPEADYLAC